MPSYKCYMCKLGDKLVHEMFYIVYQAIRKQNCQCQENFLISIELIVLLDRSFKPPRLGYVLSMFLKFW